MLQWRKGRGIRPSTTFLLKPTQFQSAPKSTAKRSATPGGGRPKKRIYHREPDLDKAMDAEKKPTLILRLRDILLSSKSKSILLRDLEKEVGFVHKWTFLSLVERYPTIFRATGSPGGPVSVSLTQTAARVSAAEGAAREAMEPVVVRNLRKLLMMSMDCQVPMEKVVLIADDLGLPPDFQLGLLPKYPQFFSVRCLGRREYLCLQSWDSSLAVTAREEKLASCSDLDLRSISPKKCRDGNYPGKFAFTMRYPAGFRPNTHYLETVVKWQKLAFPSPYLNARMIQPATPEAKKRAVAVLHEVLSLTMKKRLTSDKLDAFHNEYQLPCRLLLCLVKNHGIFYITNKGGRSTVFLKEGYREGQLVERCPLVEFQDRFCGKKTLDSRNAIAV